MLYSPPQPCPTPNHEYGNRLDLDAGGGFRTNGVVDSSGREGAYRNRFHIGSTLITAGDEPYVSLPEPDVAWGPAGNSFLTTWRYFNDPAYNIQARYVHDTHQAGAQTQGEQHRITPSGSYLAEPAVAYGTSGSRYLVTFSRDSGPSIDIYGQRMDAADSAAPQHESAFAIAQSALPEEQSDLAYSPACGCYVVTYRHIEGDTSSLYAQQVRGAHNSSGQLDSYPVPVVQATAGNDFGSQVGAGRIACASASQRCLAAWQVDRFSFAGTNSDINAQRLACTRPSNCSFVDDFSDPASGWDTGETATYRVAYEFGEYQLWAKQPSGKILVTSPEACEDCHIEVFARFEGLPFDRQGLIFAKDGAEYYAFLASPAKDECDLVRFWDGGSELISRVDCALKGADKLVVEWQAPSIRTYIGGNLVHNTTDSAFGGEGDTGVITYGQGDSRFDDYAVCALLEAGKPHKAYLPKVRK